MAEGGQFSEVLQEWKDKATRPLTIVTAGKQGMGKSTLINSLFNLEEEVKTGNSGKATTENVTKRTHHINNVVVSIVDTPGLQDFDISEREVLDDLLEVTEGKADLLFYCISLMPGSKVDEKDEKIIKLLTKKFGVEIWKRTIIVLTFANMVSQLDPDTDIQVTVDNYKQQIEKVMKKAGVKAFKFASEDDPDGTPVLTARKNPDVPQAPEGDENKMKWDQAIFFAALKKVDPESFPALLHVKIQWTSWFTLLTDFGAAVVTRLGAGIGAKLGGGAGVKIGAGIGTATAGPAGTLPGATVGGLVGAAVGGQGGFIMGSAFLKGVHQLLHANIKAALAKKVKKEQNI